MDNTSLLQLSGKRLLVLCFTLSLFFGSGARAQKLTTTDTTNAVMFSVNMQQAVADSVFSPSGDQLWLTADNGFSPFRLVPGPNHVYTALLEETLEPGMTYHYRFRINDTVYETIERLLVVVPGRINQSTWWNSPLLRQSVFTVNMGVAESTGKFDPATDSVCLYGSLNGNTGPITMQRVGSTSDYAGVFTFDPGTIHEFRYSINADSSGFELQGKPARMVRISDTVDGFYADFDNLNPAKRPMTFHCNMAYYITKHGFSPGTGFVDVAGNFNGNGANDVLFDPDGDSIYTVVLYPDTSWFSQGPLQFKFRIDGDWNRAELQGKPYREYVFHDTVQQQNVFSCFYNDIDPSVPAPPVAYDVSIQGSLVYKKFLNGVYSYENINGIAEGASVYRWFRSTNAQGTDAVPIDSAWKLTYVIDTLDIGHWLVFEVTPVAVSGDSATGKPVRVVTTGSISAWDVGFGELAALRVRLYPNPASEYITIETDHDIVLAEVTDLAGRIVLKSHPSGGRYHRMATSQLPSGFYLVRVRSENGSYGTARLIVR